MGCVFIRYVLLALSARPTQAFMMTLSVPVLISIAVGIFVVLLMIKVLIGMALIFYSGYVHNQELTLLEIQSKTRAGDKEQRKLRERLANVLP